MTKTNTQYFRTVKEIKERAEAMKKERAEAMKNHPQKNLIYDPFVGFIAR